MRARYYNTDIKRFINRDILTGSIGNTQSLNRYAYVQGNPVSYTDPFGLSPMEAQGMQAVHLMLGIYGINPVTALAANAFNAYLYYKEGNEKMGRMYGIMAGIGALTTGGFLAGTGLQAAGHVRAARYVLAGSRFAAASAACYLSVGVCVEIGKDLYRDWKNGDFGFNSRTINKIAVAGFTAFMTVATAKSAMASFKEIGTMIARDTGIAARVQDGLQSFKGGIKALVSRAGDKLKGYGEGIRTGAASLGERLKGSAKELGAKVQVAAGETSYGKSSTNYKNSLDYFKDIENINGKYYADKKIIDEIGRIEARGEDFSRLNKSVMSSRASTEGGTSIVYRYSDEYGTKYMIHEVKNADGYIIHRDFDAVRISSGQIINKGH